MPLSLVLDFYQCSLSYDKLFHPQIASPLWPSCTIIHILVMSFLISLEQIEIKNEIESEKSLWNTSLYSVCITIYFGLFNILYMSACATFALQKDHLHTKAPHECLYCHSALHTHGSATDFRNLNPSRIYIYVHIPMWDPPSCWRNHQHSWRVSFIWGVLPVKTKAALFDLEKPLR